MNRRVTSTLTDLGIESGSKVMPLILKCPNCHSRLKGPNKAKGRTLPCPTCNQPFVVTNSVIVDDDSTIPPSPLQGPTAPVPVRTANLITCPACGKTIAPAAKVCPGCGNPNTYVHPEIQRFMDARTSFQQMPQFNYKMDGFILSGSAVREKGICSA